MQLTILIRHLKPARLAQAALCCLLVLLVGCAAQQPAYRPALTESGELHLYLQPLPQETQRLAFTITGLAVLREDNHRFPLLPALTTVQGRDLVGVQKRLARAVLPPGTYQGLEITIGEASLRGEEGEAALLAPAGPFLVEQEFKIVEAEARTLFLDLSFEKLITNGYRFTPTFSLVGPERHLPSLKGFISHPGQNTVTVFNKDTMEIIQVIATGSGPAGLVLDRQRGRLYVALAGDHTIEVIEVSTGDSLGQIRLRSPDEPLELGLTPDGRKLVSANAGSQTVSIMETESLFEAARFRLDGEPAWLIMDRAGLQAYVLQPRINSVSVVNLSGNLLGASRNLEESPNRGVLSPQSDRLYLIGADSPHLLAIDAASLRTEERIFSGGSATAIAMDRDTGLVYVAGSSGEIEVIDPSVLTAIDTFSAGGATGFLVIDREENSLFALLPRAGQVRKFDLVGKSGRGAIEIDPGGYGMAVMGQE